MCLCITHVIMHKFHERFYARFATIATDGLQRMTRSIPVTPRSRTVCCMLSPSPPHYRRVIRMWSELGLVASLPSLAPT